MKTKTIVLKTGIVINDSRELGCGVSIENQNTKYMMLAYHAYSNEFYINTKGVFVFSHEYEAYFKEVELMRLSLIEANQIFNQATFTK